MPVWDTAMQIAENVFILTNELPKKEDYGLTSQLRRAAVSISSNIAEAFGRRGNLDKRKFYDYARGSAFEVKSLLMYGVRVNYFEEDSVVSIYKMIELVIHELNKISKSFG